MKEFYQGILQALAGNPPAWFESRYGLCRNYGNYLYEMTGSRSTRWDIQDKFLDAGLDRIYPFNDGSNSYEDEVKDGTVYKNPARLAWIEEHAK